MYKPGDKQSTPFYFDNTLSESDNGSIMRIKKTKLMQTIDGQ